MHYVCTVHHRTTQWIDIQYRFLSRFASDEFRIFAWLDGIDSAEVSIPYDHTVVTDEEPQTRGSRQHARRLNELGRLVIEDAASDDDTIVFLDCDAFPVSDWTSYVSEHLNSFDLAAVQRLENSNSRFPHPAFCATTVGFWRELEGDWNPTRKRDAGGVLAVQLTRKGARWRRLHRSNGLNLHPVFYGIYDDMVYHHGAGSRSPLCREDRRWCRRWNIPLSEVMEMQAKISSLVFEQLSTTPDLMLSYLRGTGTLSSVVVE